MTELSFSLTISAAAATPASNAASDDDLFAHPAIAGTPAAQTHSVVRMDGLLLLGFGPRVGEAVRTLAGELSETAG